ncbi:MAG: prephenate dehydrogenase [Actinobacteria bacterium]|nr:prephenate dehydrogenase [Actinomycetota bacterium]
MKHLRVVGSGLIGTSIALGLKNSSYVMTMIDSDPARQKLAQVLVGESSDQPVDLVLIACPLEKFKEVIAAEFALNPKALFIDIGSVKSKPQREVDSIPGLSSKFCGSHPMAGREVSGPQGARADLFQGRSWVYSPSPDSSNEVVTALVEIIAALGAVPIRLDPATHDEAVALVSHLPQIISSLLARTLRGAQESTLALSGSGLTDTTRIAGSDPGLWQEIISANNAQIRPLLESVVADLQVLIDGLGDESVVHGFIESGRSARQLIPGKHGGRHRDYHYLPIVIEDKAGQLAQLFAECAQAQVNVEDLAIEHSPGQFTGLITLALSQSDALKLSEHLKANGWSVHPSR